MKKNIVTIGIASTLLFAAACKPKAAATADAAKTAKWDCKFNGNYKEKGDASGKFSWNVVWTENEATSTISGTSKDEGGESTANGTCEKNSCKIQEEYISGNDKGKKNFWAFTYQDAETKNESVYVTVLSGSYGPSDSDRTSSGTITAKADCKSLQ